MSAVGELVQGERRGRWLVAAVACVAARRGRPRRRARSTARDPRHAADDLRQRQRAAAGRLHRQRHRRVLPGVAGAGERRGNVAAVTDSDAVRAPSTAPRVPRQRRATRPRSRTVTGDGSAGNPWDARGPTTRTSSPALESDVHVDETLTYVNGTTDVGVSFTASTAADNPRVAAALYEAADLYVAGDDAGRRLPRLGPAAPGRRHQPGRGQLGVASSRPTPWSHYQESFYNSVYSVIAATATDARRRTFNDTVNPTLVDNDVGVQWDFAERGERRRRQDVPARPGASATSSRARPIGHARHRSPARQRR